MDRAHHEKQKPLVLHKLSVEMAREARQSLARIADIGGTEAQDVTVLADRNHFTRRGDLGEVGTTCTT